MSLAASPLIIGVRHHSPACARLVVASIRRLRPAFVLIEGPADFNPRMAELMLPHRLPLAIYSYLGSPLVQQGSWTPFAEHSPEWQALVVAAEIGAQARFIDLPAWHEAMAGQLNRYADAGEAVTTAEAYEQALATQLGIEGHDALWDHLFEDPAIDLDRLAEALQLHFRQLRAVEPGSDHNAEREACMAGWIAWAVARQQGPVLVVCGGYHAPALADLWSQVEAADSEPALLTPDAGVHGPQLRFGSYLVPYSYKRLDAFAGYASGMSSPAWYQWLWAYGAEGAGQHAIRLLLTRLRRKQLPASTADFIAVHTRAQALARLRGHGCAQRIDWLDAIAGSLLKTALDVPLPWTYRGLIRAGTEPLLVELMDVLAGDESGQLAPGTPQPPLLESVRAELAAVGLSLDGEPVLDLNQAPDRQRSRVLHRLRLLQLPGVQRTHGPDLALAGEFAERWRLRSSIEQQAALIEAGAYGATLEDAARARLEERLRAAEGRIETLAEALNQAAFAGLPGVNERLLEELRLAVASEPVFEAIGAALAMLWPLFRHGQRLEMAEAPVLAVVIEAAFDRGLWLLEPAVAIAAEAAWSHLRALQALREVLRDQMAAVLLSDEVAADAASGFRLHVPRALAVLARKAGDPASDPLSRGAALGALLSLDGAHRHPGELAQALRLLQELPADRIGDALSGLVALAREVLVLEPGFLAGLDQLVQGLDDADFVLALPAMRAAFEWLPTRERGQLARAVLQLHQVGAMPASQLLAPLAPVGAVALAQARALEQRIIAGLESWGIVWSMEPQP